MSSEPFPDSTPAIIAMAARDYRFKRYLLVAILFGYGLWSVRDGFVRYPQENAQRVREFGIDATLPHPGYDVQLNKALGIILPPLALGFLGFSLFASRGQYRLENETLHVPGHPPIPLNSIRRLDRAKWDRKGIAYVDYQIPGTAKAGTFKLDDFVYDRDPTDKIFSAIEQVLTPVPAGQQVASVSAVALTPTTPRIPRPVAAVPPSAMNPPKR